MCTTAQLDSSKRVSKVIAPACLTLPGPHSSVSTGARACLEQKRTPRVSRGEQDRGPYPRTGHTFHLLVFLAWARKG